MLRKTVKFKNYDGVEITKDLYFNLRKDELIHMQFEEDGGLDKLLKKMQDEKDLKEIMRMFEKILKATYGEKSPDGNEFDKSEEAWKRFKSSNAYEAFYMDLISDPNNLSSFIDAVIPKFTQSEKDKFENVKNATNIVQENKTN